MGGGSSFNWESTKTVDQLMRDEITEEKLAQFKQEINQYLSGLLKDVNDRQVSVIQQHLDTIQNALEMKIDGELKLLFGGSISKNTYVNGLSDVDMLVMISDCELKELTPDSVKNYFVKRLKERLPNTEITLGNLAVTVRFSSTSQEIQLLPALSTKEGIKICKPNKNEWSNIIRPDQFARKLTEINNKCGGRIVPTIKLIKAINSNLPEESQLTGYHIESLALNAFKDYSGEKNYHDMVCHFVKYTKDAVLSPIRDRTGQTLHVDEYLGNEESPNRQRVSKAFERLSNRINRADTQMSTEQWMEMIGMD